MKRGLKIIVLSFVFVVISILALYKNFLIIYEACIESELTFLGMVSVIQTVWYMWVPSLISLLLSLLIFIFVYEKGSFREALNEFVNEQGGK